jgi:hypothetical protein
VGRTPSSRYPRTPGAAAAIAAKNTRIETKASGRLRPSTARPRPGAAPRLRSGWVRLGVTRSPGPATVQVVAEYGAERCARDTVDHHRHAYTHHRHAYTRVRRAGAHKSKVTTERLALRCARGGVSGRRPPVAGSTQPPNADYGRRTTNQDAVAKTIRCRTFGNDRSADPGFARADRGYHTASTEPEAMGPGRIHFKATR